MHGHMLHGGSQFPGVGAVALPGLKSGEQHLWLQWGKGGYWELQFQGAQNLWLQAGLAAGSVWWLRGCSVVVARAAVISSGQCCWDILLFFTPMGGTRGRWDASWWRTSEGDGAVQAECFLPPWMLPFPVLMSFWVTEAPYCPPRGSSRAVLTHGSFTLSFVWW